MGARAGGATLGARGGLLWLLFVRSCIWNAWSVRGWLVTVSRSHCGRLRPRRFLARARSVLGMCTRVCLPEVCVLGVLAFEWNGRAALRRTVTVDGWRQSVLAIAVLRRFLSRKRAVRLAWRARLSSGGFCSRRAGTCVEWTRAALHRVVIVDKILRHLRALFGL